MDSLYDATGRHIHYLRVSVTDRCNFRCRYCMPEKTQWLESEHILSDEELLRIIGAFAQLGVNKVRITGGEPLVRSNIIPFLSHVAAIPGIRELVLTTNGSQLDKYAKSLRQIGVKRLNISLDTLQRERFKQLTGQDALQCVLAGIRAAQAAGISSIKINMVVMKNVNSDELADFAALTMKYPYQIRFIEYMPFISGTDYLMTANEMKDQLQVAGFHELIPEASDQSVAQIYRLTDAKGTIGFITPMSRHFCYSCNRIRLTADGYLKPCLLANQEYLLREDLRAGLSDADLLQKIRNVILNKPSQYDLSNGKKNDRSMVRIGG
ncbi:GTP 3',8-cyclase [Sporomusaceae bacterium FL31]|nr:GTP 3',8-cyclase [Sporomusaceae bacterium FL31]GCE35301.1 GTP 3',8-cyclase [Sporomusaceae bacterium]